MTTIAVNLNKLRRRGVHRLFKMRIGKGWEVLCNPRCFFFRTPVPSYSWLRGVPFLLDENNCADAHFSGSIINHIPALHLPPSFPRQLFHHLTTCWVVTPRAKKCKKTRQLTATQSPATGPTEAPSQSVQIRVRVEGTNVANSGWTKNLSSLPQCTSSFTFHSHHKATNWKANLLTSSTSL